MRINVPSILPTHTMGPIAYNFISVRYLGSGSYDLSEVFHNSLLNNVKLQSRLGKGKGTKIQRSQGEGNERK